jgi:hypothetical protein
MFCILRMPSISSVTIGSVTVPIACNPFVTLLLPFFYPFLYPFFFPTALI